MAINIHRRFNYTGRIEIPNKDVQIDVIDDGNGHPKVVLMNLALPEGATVHGDTIWASADVVLEAWRIDTNSFFRRKIATVSELTSLKPPLFQTSLQEFEGADDIHFRIKIISAEKKLLAEADKISSQEEEAQKSDLIRVFLKDIGQELWRIDWSEVEDVGPRIFVNKNLPDPRGFLTRDAITAGAVLPQIVREVLSFIFTRDDIRDQQWAQRWIFFIETLHDQPPPNSSDEFAISEWVQEAVQAFAAKFRFFDRTDAELHDAKEADL